MAFFKCGFLKGGFFIEWQLSYVANYRNTLKGTTWQSQSVRTVETVEIFYLSRFGGKGE